MCPRPFRASETAKESGAWEENFRTIVVLMLDWMDGLRARNPKAFAGLYGMSPMNEPAHMRGSL